MIKKKGNTTNNIKAFIEGGAVFTLLETSTKKHVAFSTERDPRDLRDIIPVKAKVKGNSFQRIGTIGQEKKFRGAGKFEYEIFKVFWEGLKMSYVQTNIEFWNRCKCYRCGRQLTDPASIALGIGPGCREVIHGTQF